MTCGALETDVIHVFEFVIRTSGNWGIFEPLLILRSAGEKLAQVFELELLVSTGCKYFGIMPDADRKMLKQARPRQGRDESSRAESGEAEWLGQGEPGAKDTLEAKERTSKSFSRLRIRLSGGFESSIRFNCSWANYGEPCTAVHRYKTRVESIASENGYVDAAFSKEKINVGRRTTWRGKKEGGEGRSLKLLQEMATDVALIVEQIEGASLFRKYASPDRSTSRMNVDNATNRSFLGPGGTMESKRIEIANVR
ncbi:hypothetical protein KM043_006757 [Ampulex compressa]|nr:hypothetical protein KM043_006757 [Ampulex compressa]